MRGGKKAVSCGHLDTQKIQKQMAMLKRFQTRGEGNSSSISSRNKSDVNELAETLCEGQSKHPFMWQPLESAITAESLARISTWKQAFLIDVLDSLNSTKRILLLEKLRRVNPTFLNLPVEAVARLKSSSFANMLMPNTNALLQHTSLVEPALFYGLRLSLPEEDVPLVLAKTWTRFVHLLDDPSFNTLNTQFVLAVQLQRKQEQEEKQAKEARAKERRERKEKKEKKEQEIRRQEQQFAKRLAKRREDLEAQQKLEDAAREAQDKEEASIRQERAKEEAACRAKEEMARREKEEAARRAKEEAECREKEEAACRTKEEAACRTREEDEAARRAKAKTEREQMDEARLKAEAAVQAAKAQAEKKARAEAQTRAEEERERQVNLLLQSTDERVHSEEEAKDNKEEEKRLEWLKEEDARSENQRYAEPELQFRREAPLEVHPRLEWLTSKSGEHWGVDQEANWDEKETDLREIEQNDTACGSPREDSFGIESANNWQELDNGGFQQLMGVSSEFGDESLSRMSSSPTEYNDNFDLSALLQRVTLKPAP